MAWFDHSGVGLHWREDGDPGGPPLLLLNSLGTDLRLWDGVIAKVNRFRIIRLDTRGHGLSDAPAGPYTLEALVSDVEALVDELGLSSLTVAGVSLGGMMAQLLGARRPSQVARLVLSNTAPKMGTATLWRERIAAVEKHGLDGIADGVLDRWFHSAFRNDSDIGFWRNMLLRTPAPGYLGCCEALAEADLSQSTTGLRMPALVIAGSEDGASPPELVRSLAEMIPGAQYEEFSETGHLPMAEVPGRFGDVVAEFLSEAIDD
ncbi:MAG: 3-oxoadipate enol-lactonase [Pseudomonadota bacterium]